MGSVVMRGTTATPSRTRSVAAATNRSVVIASAHAVPAFHDGMPSSLNGYRGLNVAGTAVWELVQTESYPSCSAARATPRTVWRVGRRYEGSITPMRTAAQSRHRASPPFGVVPRYHGRTVS